MIQADSGMPRLTHIALVFFVAAATARAQNSPRFVDAGKELVITYGPVSLPARTTHDEMKELPTLTVMLPADGWIRGMDVDLIDSHGRKLPQHLLHHLSAMAPDERDLFNPVMMRFGAAGAETGSIDLPRFIGIRVHKGDSLFVSIMLHNDTDTAYDDVVVRARAPFTHADALLPALTVYPMGMVIGPKDKPNVFDLPPGRSEQYWEGSPAVAVRLLGVMGHLHQYGVLLRLEDRTAKTVLLEERPKTDSAGNILSMPLSSFLWTFGKPIYPSHVYRLTAVYENPTGRTIPDGGMGVLGGIVMLSSGTWPRVDRNNAEYKKDVEAILHSDHQMAMP